MRFAREAFFARHKHDKQFAELGEQRRRTEMIVILMEAPWRVVSRNFQIEMDFINVTIIQHPSSLYLSRARLKWSKGSIDFQSIASLSFAAARSAHVYCMSQKPLPFPPGFAVIRFQLDAAGEGRPHRWYAADGSDGVSLEYGPAAFSVS